MSIKYSFWMFCYHPLPFAAAYASLCSCIFHELLKMRMSLLKPVLVDGKTWFKAVLMHSSIWIARECQPQHQPTNMCHYKATSTIWRPTEISQKRIKSIVLLAPMLKVHETNQEGPRAPSSITKCRKWLHQKDNLSYKEEE